MNREKKDFHELNDSLLLDEDLCVQQYYDQLLVLTAIASYNREESLWRIRWKQAMTWESDMNIHIHCLAYKAALKWWEQLLSWKISLESLCRKVHSILLHWSEKKNFRLIPGELRKWVVFIWWESWEVHDSQFICPPSHAIEQWFHDIETLIRDKLSWNSSDVKNIWWSIHYLVNKLHPFLDWNGRLARILSVSFIEHFWEKDVRWFTFLSEILASNNRYGLDYSSIFNTKEEEELTSKIKNQWTQRVYFSDGMNSFEGNNDMNFQDYIQALDIESPSENFTKILNISEENKELISIIVEVFLKAKSLNWDHILIWKFINKLFDITSMIINSWEYQILTIDKEIINSVIPSSDGKLKKSSIKNLLILVNHMREKLSRVWINIHIEDSLYTKAFELWIMSDDIITQQIRSRLWEIL